MKYVCVLTLKILISSLPKKINNNNCLRKLVSLTYRGNILQTFYFNNEKDYIKVKMWKVDLSQRKKEISKNLVNPCYLNNILFK